METVNTTHTPGPWTVDKDIMQQVHTYTIRAGGAGGAEIAKCNNHLSHREANAALIAAAPELLEALETVRSMPGFEADEKYGCMVIAAIAKAKGQ